MHILLILVLPAHLNVSIQHTSDIQKDESWAVDDRQCVAVDDVSVVIPAEILYYVAVNIHRSSISVWLMSVH